MFHRKKIKILLNKDFILERKVINELKQKIKNEKNNNELLKNQLIKLNENYKETKSIALIKIKSELKDLKFIKNSYSKKELEKYNNNSIKGLKRIYDFKYNSITFPIMDKVIFAESEIEKLKQSINDFKEMPVDKQIIDKAKLEDQIYSLINEQETQVINFKNDYIESKRKAKHYLKELKKQFIINSKIICRSNEPKTNKKTEKDKLKIILLEKQMEVVTLYGKSNI